jgi:hypothetical protein
LRELQRRWLRASRSERVDLKREQKRLRNEHRTVENAIVQGLLDTADVVLALSAKDVVVFANVTPDGTSLTSVIVREELYVPAAG